MTHEELQSSLSEYIEGRLPAEEHRFLEAHLDACEECEEILSDLRSLREIIARNRDALFDEHPGPELLIRHLGGEDHPERERVERHLSVCASCDLEATPLQTGARPSRHAGRGSAFRLLEAAALIVAGLLLGLLVAQVRHRSASAWEGPIDLPVLERTTRGREPMTRIRVRPGQSSFVLAVPVDIDADLDATEMVRLTVLGPDGSTVYSLLEPAAWYRAVTDRSGIVPLSIRSDRLPAGTCRVVITAAGAPGGREAVLWFQVVRGEPHVTD
jgi:hypothetical protein